jgi:glutaredoxin
MQWYLRIGGGWLMSDGNQTTKSMANQNIEITAYLKTFCGWSEGVRAVFRKYGLEFTEKDIIKNPALRWEMEQKSGQSLSPCVMVNDTMLADVSGEEVETWLVQSGLLEKSEVQPDAPIDSACSDAQHAAMDAAARFGGESSGANVRLID